jgi:hypothetical protein
MESIQMKYVTGEKIQELADHTIVCIDQPLVKEQLKNTNCRYTYFDRTKTVTSLPEEVLNANILFVYTHVMDFFIDRIFPLLKHPFTLVSHNSDNSVDARYLKLLDNGMLVKWYAQNADIEHPKLVPIPIGIANSQWPHGDLKIFDKIRNEHNVKDNLVYKNFDVNTSHCNRCHVEIATSRNGIPMAPRKPLEDFLRDISKSYFTICPMGSGTDCHRIWEALYLGSVPVVADCPHNRGFRDLPIVFIPEGQFRNWEMVTRKFLEDKYNEMKNKTYDMSKIDLNYWHNRIRV